MIDPQLIPRVAQRFKALSDPFRLRLLSFLMEGETTVGELAEVCERKQPNVSQQLASLSRAGLVSSRKQGQRVFYRISDPYLARICSSVCEALAEDARREAPFRRRLGRRASLTSREVNRG